MANIKEYIKKVMDGTVSLEEQQAALAQVEKTIVEAKQRRDESVGQKADMVVQALKTIEAKLEAKLVELNNTPAMQGVQGPTGKAGKDGLNGKDGRDGINGKDGIDGKDGVDGKDGISVVDANIDFDGSLVIYLSNGSEIDAGQILSPEVAQNIIISSGGSGTSQVVTDTLVSLQTQINTLTGIDGTLGTMAQQDANAVAITGGTINGTTIGATTPSTGNFTTITGQTEVLKGTGQNLVRQSQALATSPWFNANLTSITNNTTDLTAPDGTSTATKLVAATSSASVGQNIGNLTTIPYQYSVYARCDTGTLSVSLICYLSASPFTSILVQNVTLTTSWQRFSFTTSVPPALAGYNYQFNINAIGTAYVWGTQLEIGSTVNTYIPTTTTAIYGTPSLSFSGVAGLGLQSDGSLYVSPAGTGALQAQATTSTTAGGNARGANSVDWQTSRNAASQVASGQQATVSGGNANTASSTYTTVVGGNFNNASGFGSAILGGNANTASNSYAVLIGGENNIASGSRAIVGGGNSNTAGGFFNFIGGGFTNSATSGAAVTTQAAATNGVTNGSTAVTLAASNASIRVGQLITGTGIVSFTYVAAISGTSLTLSQNANATGTPTLSFFTPHGVVVGGGNNQATGSYSFIGGGGDAGTAANRNVASGDWSTVGGGWKNTASGLFGGALSGTNNIASGVASVVCGGGSFGNITQISGNTASGLASFVGAGFSNTASSNATFVGSGASNTANGLYASVLAGSNGTTRSIWGNHVLTSLNPFSTPQGSSQSATLVLGKQTTDATATALTCDGAAAGTVNQVIMPNNSAYFFKGSVIAGVTGAGNSKAWSIEGAIKRGANAASTVLIGTPSVNLVAQDAGAATWTVAITADTTNGGIAVTVTGQAATTIRWVAKVETTEMTF